MLLSALNMHFGTSFFRLTVDSSCTALRQYGYTPEGVCILKEEEEEEEEEEAHTTRATANNEDGSFEYPQHMFWMKNEYLFIYLI